MLLMGHALSAGCGALATRQAALAAELPAEVDCTGINKGPARFWGVVDWLVLSVFK